MPQLMHSVAAFATRRCGELGDRLATLSARVELPRKWPSACFHLSKNSLMSQARSLITGILRNGSMVRRLSRSTLLTCVRQVQRGIPFTIIAQEPHMPTRQAKR